MLEILASGWNGRRASAAVVVAINMIVGVFGAAGPAAADDLVGNLHTTLLEDISLSEFDIVQAFTTGPNVTGYLLEAISIDFSRGATIIPGSDSLRSPVYVYLHEDNGNGRPNHAQGGQVAVLTKDGITYAGPETRVNKYKVWKARCYPRPPHGGGCISEASSVHLEPGSTYWVYVWAGDSDNTATVSITGNVDRGAAGWTIANDVLRKPRVSGYAAWASHTSTTCGTLTQCAMFFKAEGKTNPAVNVSINDVTVTEGIDATADFVVSLSQATSGVVTLAYSTSSNTADVDDDYTATIGTLTFAPGETTKTVSVPILDDAMAEGQEKFNLLIKDAVGATIPHADRLGVTTIINADPLALSISDATATEGIDATMDFTVTLNRATNRTVTVNFLFSSGTADFSDVEYVQTEQSVTFAPGETEKTYSIGIVDDTVNEPSETFSVVVQSPHLTTDHLILADSVGEGTILNTETLTASFENVPQDHDGSTAFTFNVAFTSDVSIGPAAMRDHAFTATNGDVTAASRVNGSSDRWLITVDPDGDDAVTITLPGNRACGSQGSICSDEDNPVQLSNSPSATVARLTGTALTASFSNVPDEHTGADFTFDLAFTDELAAGWEKIKAAFRVSGGSINRVSRKTQGSDLAWRVKVRPAGTGDLTITLQATAQCSSSGAILHR